MRIRVLGDTPVPGHERRAVTVQVADMRNNRHDHQGKQDPLNEGRNSITATALTMMAAHRKVLFLIAATTKLIGGSLWANADKSHTQCMG